MNEDERVGAGCLTLAGVVLIAVAVGISFGAQWGFALVGVALLCAAAVGAGRHG